MATAKKSSKGNGSLSGLKASTKRVGPVDPKGAYTKVQEKTLAGAKGKASLTKDKQLGATKMKMGGKMAKQAAIAIAMKKAGKAPKKKMQYGGEAASMAPTMKKGGMVKKCKSGCY